MSFFVVSFTGAFSALTRIEGYGTDNVYNWMAPYAALQGAVFAGVGGAASAADDLENGFFDPAHVPVGVTPLELQLGWRLDLEREVERETAE